QNGTDPANLLPPCACRHGIPALFLCLFCRKLCLYSQTRVEMGLAGRIRCRSRGGLLHGKHHHRSDLGSSSLGHLVDLGLETHAHLCALVVIYLLSVVANARGRPRSASPGQRDLRDFRVSGRASGLRIDSMVAHAASPAGDYGRFGVWARTDDGKGFLVLVLQSSNPHGFSCARALSTRGDARGSAIDRACGGGGMNEHFWIVFWAY